MATGPALNLYILSDAFLEVTGQILVIVASWIDWVFTEYLLLSNVISAGLLLGLADISIQTLEVFVVGTRPAYERTRNYHSMQVGMVLGVFNHLWYSALESYLQGRGLATVFKKIALDQAVAGPFFSSAFLVGMGLLEGRSVPHIYDEWSQKFIHIYMVDWMFWPLAQFINFYLVPYRFRVFYVNFATFIWNTFLCYAKHSSEEMIRGRPGRSRRSDVSPTRLDLHRRPERDGREVRSSSGTRSPNSRSRSQKKSRPKRESRLQTKRTSPKPKLRQRRKPSTSPHKLPDPKPPTANHNRPSTMKSIICLRKYLPFVGQSPSFLNDQPEHTRGCLSEATEASEDHTERTASAHSCDACTSDSSVGTTESYGTKVSDRSSEATTTAAISRSVARKRSTVIPRGSAAPAQQQQKHVKMPAIKKLGIFAEADVKVPCVQEILAKKKKPESRTSLGARRIPAHRKATSGLKTGTAVGRITDAVSDNLPKGRWAGGAGAGVVRTVGTIQTFPLRSTTVVRGNPTTQTLEEIREAVQELKGEVTRSHRELSAALSDTQAQVSRLQEMCSLIFVSVDEGTRDLAVKADQLASWVQVERRLEAGELKAVLEEVLGRGNV